MQMRLALDQISKDKKINVSSLNEKQLEMYEKIIHGQEFNNELNTDYIIYKYNMFFILFFY